jgi:hypothetical protein
MRVRNKLHRLRQVFERLAETTRQSLRWHIVAACGAQQRRNV